jgi:hypothetical protein
MTMLAVWLVSGTVIRHRDSYLHAPWLAPVLIMVAFHWIGLFYTPDLHGMGIKLAKKTYYWLFAMASAGVLLTEKRGDRLMGAFLIGLTLNACVAFLQFARLVPTVADPDDYGFTGLYGGYNSLAVLLVLGILTACFYFEKHRVTRRKWLYAGCMVILFLHLSLIQSRAGYLLLLLLSPVVFYKILKTKRISRIIVIYAVMVGALFASPMVRDRSMKTLVKIEKQIRAGREVRSGKKYSKNFDRMYMWYWAVSLFREHPFLGVGTGGYKKATLAAGGELGINHPHSNFFYMMASFGLGGGIVYLWLFWVILRTGWRYRDRAVGFFSLSSATVLLINGMTETNMMDAGGAMLLSLTAGLQAALSVEQPPSVETET